MSIFNVSLSCLGSSLFPSGPANIPSGSLHISFWILRLRFRFRHRCFASGILRFPIWLKSPDPIDRTLLINQHRHFPYPQYAHPIGAPLSPPMPESNFGHRYAHDHRISKSFNPRHRAQALAPPAPRSADAHVAIGIILSNGENGKDQFQCHVPACTNVTFGRVADLKRHHASRHGGHGKRRQQFWCPVGGCMSTLATNTAVPGALADLYYDRRSQRHGEKGRISP